MYKSLLTVICAAAVLPQTTAYFQTDALNSTTIAATASYSTGTASVGSISATTVNSNSSAYTGSTLPYSQSDPSCNPPPDVYLNVPKLQVDNVTLNVTEVGAQIALNLNIANLITVDAGVNLTLQDVYLNIAGVKAQLELEVRLNKLVEIVNRTFDSLDLSPGLIGLANGLGSVGNLTSGTGSTLTGLLNGLGGTVGGVTSAAGSTVSGVGSTASSTIGSVASSAPSVVSTVTGAAGSVASSVPTVPAKKK